MYRAATYAVLTAAVLAFASTAPAQTTQVAVWRISHVMTGDGEFTAAMEHVISTWAQDQHRGVLAGKVLAYRVYAIDAPDKPNRGLLATVLHSSPVEAAPASSLLQMGAPALSPETKLREVLSWERPAGVERDERRFADDWGGSGRGLLNSDLTHK